MEFVIRAKAALGYCHHQSRIFERNAIKKLKQSPSRESVRIGLPLSENASGASASRILDETLFLQHCSQLTTNHSAFASENVTAVSRLAFGSLFLFDTKRINHDSFLSQRHLRESRISR
jgi:hypothetical protein